MVALLTEFTVPGSNPASPNLQEHVSSLVGRVGIATAGWPLRGGRGKNIAEKYKKI
jgi:hypothetical protein